MLAEPLKSLGKNGKTLKIARNSLKRKKGKEITKGKEKKIREDILGTSSVCANGNRLQNCLPPLAIKIKRLLKFQIILGGPDPYLCLASSFCNFDRGSLARHIGICNCDLDAFPGDPNRCVTSQHRQHYKKIETFFHITEQKTYIHNSFLVDISAPKKKYLASPPGNSPNSLQTPSRPLGPSPS